MARGWVDFFLLVRKEVALRRLFSFAFQSAEPVPVEFRRNFIHLYFDIGWFGVLNGSLLAFFSIYAARLGASSAQIGLLSALPSVVSMILALPTGGWLERRPIGRAVFITSVMQRSFYLLFAFFPLLLEWMTNEVQIWALIVATLLMSIPGTALGMGFNALFGAAVPETWRGYVAGIRNAVFSITTIVVTLLSGYLLVQIEFPFGYAWVFGMGAVGAAMSSLHLWFVRPVEVIPASTRKDALLALVGFREWLRQRLRLDVLRSNFRRPLLLLVFFHFVQYLPIPLFSVYSVNVLQLDDQVLSLGTALFYVSDFFGSTQFARISRRWGNKTVTGVGLMMLAAYPFFLGLARDGTLYLVASIVGGFAWAMAGGALFNYLLEHVPGDDRPAYLAWFTLGSNAAILAGSLLGPVVGGWIGLVGALLVFGFLRLIAGFSIVRWG